MIYTNFEMFLSSRTVLTSTMWFEHHAYHERANDTHVAIDIEPEGSYSMVYDQLQEWEEAGLLSFETCEAREKDSFDDVLEDS
jgi:hypothetical protein